MDEIAFGRGFKALRTKRNLRQLDVARSAGVSRGVIVRIETGHSASMTVKALEKAGAVLGARVICRLSWNGEGLDRLLDAGHAAIVDKVVRILEADGWTVATEASFNHFGERGSIDILAFHSASRIVLVVEVKSVVPDVQVTLVGIDRKVRLAREIARSRGWNAVAVGSLLVIRDDRTSRRRIDAHTATFANAFPDRARAIRAWLARPSAAHPIRGLWFLTGEPHAATRQRIRRPDPGR
jgi:transcriptional regulator with XRE-family HTH domain